MCKADIYEKTIAAIEDDIVQLKIEYQNLYHLEHFRRANVLQAIRNAREIIDELKQEKQNVS